MITNFDTNKVYIAQGLGLPTYVKTAYSLFSSLYNSQISCDLLPCTYLPFHIWVRDYMPIQVRKDKFVCFRYEPDYLKNYPEYKPETNSIIEQLGIKLCYSSINLDGGNVISCGDKVILTDKIFKENPQYNHTKLIDELADLLEAEIVLIPWDKYEEYGHADGMVRYIEGNRVLLNNYCDFDKLLRKRLVNELSPHFEIEELHYGTYAKNSWSYINFLHVGHDIFVPMLNEKIDFIAYEQIATTYSMCKCHQINNCINLVKEGGALNCSTWNISCKLSDIEQEQVLF